jgi:hypothetical protein
MLHRQSRGLGLTFTIILLSLGTLSALARAQAPKNDSGGRGGPAPGGRVFGTVESIGVDRFTVKKMDGGSATVMVDDQTRYRQGQQDIQLEDLKVGDQVMAFGRPNENKEILARMVRRVTEQEMARMPKPGEFAFGEIVSIDKHRLTLRNRRDGEKVVTLSEQTEFIKSGQPSTLDELKVGDRVFVLGKEANGTFSATRVTSGQMGFRGGFGREGQGPSGDQHEP